MLDPPLVTVEGIASGEKYAVQNPESSNCLFHRRSLVWLRDKVFSVPASRAFVIIQGADQ
jgi:hypothetical protein